VIVDTSALVAIACDEPEAAAFTDLLDTASRVAVSAATLLEASMVLRDAAGRAFVDVVADALTVVPFDASQLAVARQAHERFGRGTGHPARLNLGDCFSYALAVTTGEPLLFKGEGFARTDVMPAYRPS